MTFTSDLQADSPRFDMFAILRRFERSFPDRPRIGNSETLKDDYVRLGEDPYLEFPASNVGAVRLDAEGQFRVFVKFLGLLGPQGRSAACRRRRKPISGCSLAQRRCVSALPRSVQQPLPAIVLSGLGQLASPIAHHDRPNDGPVRRLHRLDDRHRHQSRYKQSRFDLPTWASSALPA